MIVGKVFRFKICHLLVSLSLAIGLYGCTLDLFDQEADQEPAPTSPVRVAQRARPGEEKPSPPSAPINEATLENVFKLKGLRVRDERGQTTVYIEFSEPVTEYRHFTLTQPSRIVLDVFGDIKRRAQLESFPINTSWVSRLRLSPSKGYLRMIALLAAAKVPAYVIEPHNDGLKVIIGSPNPKVTAKKDLQLVQGGKRMGMGVAQAEPPTPEVSEALPEAPTPQATPTEEKKYTGQRISLDFKDADIKNVFRLLAEISGLNIVVTDDVVKKVTVRLVDVPWDQAMDILLETNGLGKEEVGNVVRISTVQRLRSERDAIRAAQEAEKKLESLQTAYLTVNYAKATEIVEKIKAAKVLTERGEAIPDDRTNTIFIRDIKKAVEEANEMVTRLDTRTAQVQIESNIIETTPTFARALGVELGFDAQIRSPQNEPERVVKFRSDARAGSPFVTDTLGLAFSVIQNRVGVLRNINSVLTAAETEGNIKIISRPSVVTLNNVASTIQSLRIVRIALPTGTTNIASGTGSAAGAAVATEQVNVGIILNVTPQVSSDGFVLMNINVKSSSLSATEQAGVIPDELSREAISNVLVKNGETVVIGGIMKDTRQESESGVPFLKNIPVFGWLFKNIRLQQDFEELMVFITPRILAGGAKDLPTAEQLWRDAMNKTEGG